MFKGSVTYPWHPGGVVMVHVHGRDVAQRAARVGRVPAERRLLVPVDVGKHEAMALVADATGERLVAPFIFSLDRPGLGQLVGRVLEVATTRGDVQVEIGVESAGHYHRPVTASGMLPASWTVVELNPAHVTEQRRVLGKRGVKTDQVDLAAMFDLLVAGRGLVVAQRSEALQQLQAWVAMRHRRITAVIALKNQLLGQMDRAFPGAGRCVSTSLLELKVGRLVIAEFTDPSRLARLGVERFRRFAAARDVIVGRKVAQRFVEAARAAVPLEGAGTARELVAADLALLERLECQADEAERRIGELLPATPFAILTTTPGWATVRAGRYGAAVGEPTRWPTPRQLYRAAGLTPKTYESAGTRHDGQICREGSVELRGALLELGMGLWLCEHTGRQRAHNLKARGKPAGIIACAMARRANKIAFAMVRDQTPYDPSRWRD
jgi:transposase